MRGDNQVLARTRDEIAHDGGLDVNRLHVSFSQNAARVANWLHSEAFCFAMQTFFDSDKVGKLVSARRRNQHARRVRYPAYSAMALATSRVESLPPSPRRVRVTAATGHVVGVHFAFGDDDPSRIRVFGTGRFQLHFNHLIFFSSLSTTLNSESPVTSSALLVLAKAAAKQSAYDIFLVALKTAA